MESIDKNLSEISAFIEVYIAEIENAKAQTKVFSENDMHSSYLQAKHSIPNSHLSHFHNGSGEMVSVRSRA